MFTSKVERYLTDEELEEMRQEREDAKAGRGSSTVANDG